MNRAVGLALAAIVAASLAVAPAATASPFTSWDQRLAHLVTAPGLSPTGLLGAANPAVVGRLGTSESLFAWADDGGASSWGAYSAVPHLGFAAIRRDRGAAATTDYRLSLASGDAGAAFGLGWGWSSGHGAPGPVWTAGTVLQPSRRWSLGATWTAATDGDTREAAADLGLRPFASPRLTLFAAGARSRGGVDADHWRLGGALRLQEGLYVSTSADDEGTLRLGLRFELGTFGASSQARRLDGDTRGVYTVRVGPHRGDALAGWRRRHPAFLRLDLNGPVRHRTYPLFDQGQAQLALLATLRRAAADPGVGGVAVNLSGLHLDSAKAWELRQALQGLRDSGRAVVVYLDRADLGRYDLASVADRIVIDPAGLLVLHGFAAGQVYLAGALNKLGIGTQEWRYREYKSAFETLNRTDMSPRDREQWQTIIDQDYARVRADVVASRDISAARFDALVDSVTVLRPAAAVAAGLADTVGRWEAVEDLVRQLGGSGRFVTAAGLARPVGEEWGAPPTVAVVYALGECAMDRGMGARDLSRHLRDLADDDGVDAVVLRVDSPGGDVLASDVVAGALARVRAQKPVVVSQARLAASGGYWISLESDAILATPATLTGSIGVIGGWIYNRGFRQRLGLTVDHVQAGRHADLGLGIPLPLLGTLPDRPLTEDEAARTDQVMAALYDDFVGRVATARGSTPAAVDSIARGRVWSGADALQVGLVDELGGLDTAIDRARERLGVDRRRPLRVVEVPRLPWFAARQLPLPGLSALSGRAGEPPWLSWLRFRVDHNGEPLLLLPWPFLDAAGQGAGPDWR